MDSIIVGDFTAYMEKKELVDTFLRFGLLFGVLQKSESNRTQSSRGEGLS